MKIKSQARNFTIPQLTIKLAPRKNSKAYNKNMNVRRDTDNQIKLIAKTEKTTIDEVLYNALSIYSQLKKFGVFSN